MYAKRRQSNEFKSKIIDVHSHVGIHTGMYAQADYPCCQSIEGLYYRQLTGGIDVNVVFPFGCYPTSSFPYEIDNLRLMKEVYEFCPEISDRFLPFVCMDTENKVSEQITAIKELAKTYPIYGIKINPVDRKVPVKTLHDKGRVILEFAGKLDIPLLFHAVPDGIDAYSSAEDILDIAETNHNLRFCLAHCLLFCKDLLDRAKILPNVWVDTAAIKIQVNLVNDLIKSYSLNKNRLILADFNCYFDVIKKLITDYPDLIIWGSDSPAYTFITSRQQVENKTCNFILPGRYEDEIAALKSLPKNKIKKISNENTLNFIFG